MELGAMGLKASMNVQSLSGDAEVYLGQARVVVAGTPE